MPCADVTRVELEGEWQVMIYHTQSRPQPMTAPAELQWQKIAMRQKDLAIACFDAVHSIWRQFLARKK
jgi:hypothetical protein